jgi:DNA-binding transcriptional regulator YdaS (Cro superfamily)
MDINTYLSNTETAASLARKLGISPVLVSQWRNGIRPIPIERCPDIERATEGAVTRRDLRPDDWQRIWPELAEQAA